jgi:hypothetical protein
MNGAAALQLVEPAPAPSGEIEHAIGEAVVAAVCIVARGCFEFQDGGLALATKNAGADKIATLYRLQQAAPVGIDFTAVARREGKAILRAYLDADSDFCARHGPGAGESTIDLYLDGVLEILSNVTEFMAH